MPWFDIENAQRIQGPAIGYFPTTTRTDSYLTLASNDDSIDLSVMNGLSIVGIVMVIAGAALLAYGGFTTTKKENVIDLGPLKVEAEVKERHQVPPVLSWALLGGGLVVVVLGLRKK